MGKNNRPRGDDRPRRGVRLNALGAQPRAPTVADAPYDLPDGWKWTTVADVISDAQPGFASGKKDVPRGINHLRMNNIGADCQLNLDSVFTVPKELAKPRYLAQLNDVLVCHTNSAKLVGKTALFNVPGVYAFSNHITRLRVAPNLIDPQWLWRVMTTLWRERYFENRCKQWVNQATIERATLLAAPVPLPPLPEQQRIVARIETLFAESRTARDALERVPALLKRFRQSVLASAFRGELTEHQTSEVSKTSEVFTAAAPYELPEGWMWTTIGKACAVNPTMQWPQGFAKNKPVHFVPMSAVDGELGTIVTPEPRPIGEVWKGYKRFQNGDVIFARITPCMENGKAAIAKNLLNGIGLGSTEYHILRPSEKILVEWIYHFVRQQSFRNDAARAMTGTAGQLRVPADFVTQTSIPLAPLAEQRRIVAKIESLFAQADAIERAVAIAQQRADKVDQSILARAFRGGL